MKRNLITVILLIAYGCTGSSTDSGSQNPVATFELIHTVQNETFVAQTSDPDVIAKARSELSKPMGERQLHINGSIAAGAGGVNDPWSWHFNIGEWDLVEVSAEVCDAWPSYIENNLEDWMQSVGAFCPWSGRVSKEL